MLKLPAFLRSRTALAGGIVLALVGGAVVAQTVQPAPIQWDARKLDQLDRNVRRLERALTQRNAAGDPVIIETDPEVVALTGRVTGMDRRVADLEASLQRVNGDLERLTFQLDESQHDNAALGGRLRDAESRLKTIEDAARAEAELNAPIVSNSPTGDAARDLAAAVRLAGTDPARGDRALQTVIVTWPDTPQAAEANSRIGDMRRAENDNAGAARAYANALNGWPTTTWAPATTLELAAALSAGGDKTRACGALGEFSRRYAEAASAPVRARATQLRTQIGCAAAPAPTRPATPRRGG